MIQQIRHSTHDRKVDVRLFDEIDRAFAHRRDRRTHIRIFTQENDRRRGVIRAQALEQFQSGHAGQHHVGDQAAAGMFGRGSEITFRTVVVLNLGIQVSQQGTKLAAIRGVGFDHGNDGAGIRHKMIRREKRAATATEREKPEPQGGLGAVDSPMGRGRMLVSWTSSKSEKVALVLKEMQRR